jgi:hypothetical protein
MAVSLARDALSPLHAGGEERPARAELRRQIGRLERELGGLFAAAFPRVRIDTSAPAGAAEPRIVGLGELELIRDALVERIAEARRALSDRAELDARNREVLQRMLADPAAYKWARISRDDIGVSGCGHWHSRPRLGPLGMLMGWWRVKVSSGCPLSERLAAVERSAKGG